MFQGHIDMETATPVEASAIPDVLFERGLYWASGRSGVVNLVAAHKWFNLAALKGRVEAVALRREVAEMMSDTANSPPENSGPAGLPASASLRHCAAKPVSSIEIDIWCSFRL